MLSGKFGVATSSPMELIDVTSQLQDIIATNNITQGLCTIFNPHTTAGVTINEGADPNVQGDIIGAMRRIVPSDYPYKHREGNSTSHVMATLTGCSVSLFIAQGQLQLGTWQRIFFCEFDGPRQRELTWQILSG